MTRIFIATESSADKYVAEIITQLIGETGLEIDQSPLNPNLGQDPMWRDW